MTLSCPNPTTAVATITNAVKAVPSAVTASQLIATAFVGSPRILRLPPLTARRSATDVRLSRKKSADSTALFPEACYGFKVLLGVSQLTLGNGSAFFEIEQVRPRHDVGAARSDLGAQLLKVRQRFSGRHRGEELLVERLDIARVFLRNERLSVSFDLVIALRVVHDLEERLRLHAEIIKKVMI